MFASPGAHALVVRMAGVIEVLVDEEQATAAAEHATQLADTRIRIGPVMHHVDGPGSIHAGVTNGKMLGGSVYDLESSASGLPKPSHLEHEAHKRRRIDRDDVGT